MIVGEAARLFTYMRVSGVWVRNWIDYYRLAVKFIDFCFDARRGTRRARMKHIVLNTQTGGS